MKYLITGISGFVGGHYLEYLASKASDSRIAGIDMAYPLFLKPIAEGSGKGVNARSKVDNREQLEQTARGLLKQFRQPVLVEEFLPGREFTVGITGTGADAAVLGVMEIKPTAKGTQSGYSYENKEHWEDRVTLHLVDDAEARAAGDVALRAWRAVGGAFIGVPCGRRRR